MNLRLIKLSFLLLVLVVMAWNINVPAIFAFISILSLDKLLLAFVNLLAVILSVAFYVLAERKIMGSVQRRLGPNVVGIWGLLQPIADGVKALSKQFILPRRGDATLFIIAPALALFLALIGWSLIPFEFLTEQISDINMGILLLFAIGSFHVYSVILSGWASNSKYALLGALRSSAQMISYEVSLGLSILPIIMCVGSANLVEIVAAQETVWFIWPMFPLAVLFFISSLAETNRAPFDLPEAEAELVAGYNVEYSGMTFAMFFLGEYGSMSLNGAINVILFFGGWYAPFTFLEIFPPFIFFVTKMLFFTFLFVWVRASLPRYRYDQLMDIGWKVFLPFTLGFLIFAFAMINI